MIFHSVLSFLFSLCLLAHPLSFFVFCFAFSHFFFFCSSSFSSFLIPYISLSLCFHIYFLFFSPSLSSFLLFGLSLAYLLFIIKVSLLCSFDAENVLSKMYLGLIGAVRLRKEAVGARRLACFTMREDREAEGPDGLPARWHSAPAGPALEAGGGERPRIRGEY
ncbi:uncharacterized protein VTP21DRAFT_5844 [Calcarisporiella thermophila]|uniref:uncharacterized protein n=1 Tax=Calcarisporiella thermophila TaxID=911321 RepID=UPI00374339E1